MINILFVFLCLATGSHSQRFDGMQSTLKEDLEFERQLKLINKLPLKSIHTKFGYIVDCIDINKQPAFDHPLLKNHKLQRKPSFLQTVAKTSKNNSSNKPIIGLEKDSCPTGTVPIRRTTKQDLIGAESLLNTHVLTQDSPASHVAGISLITLPNSYYGVSGINSIYNPKVTKDQSTAAHIWVQNGEGDGINAIMAGWQVSPQLYNDDATHFYSIWTSDNSKKTGCYDVQCAGFVQTDHQVYLGATVPKTSVYGRPMEVMLVSLSLDPDTGNWWLSMDEKMIGYFPAALFSNLASASKVGWGGMTTTSTGDPSPPMGSGYFPDHSLLRACYFRSVTFQNSSRVDNGPEIDLTEKYTDKPNCFGAEYYGYQNEDVGYALEFGGPGGNCGD